MTITWRLFATALALVAGTARLLGTIAVLILRLVMITAAALGGGWTTAAVVLGGQRTARRNNYR